MITWIANWDVAIAEKADIFNLATDSDTVLIDARVAFDNEGEPDHYILGVLLRIMRYNHNYTRRKIILFCDAGIDRSPFVMACFIHEECTDGSSFPECYAAIKRDRPQIIEHWEWFEGERE